MRHRIPALTALLLLCLTSTACTPAGPLETTTPPPVTTTAQDTTATQDPPPLATTNTISRNATVTTRDGYTYTMTIDATIGDPVNDPTDAKPGNTNLFQPLTGTLTIINTTPGHSLPVFLNNPVLSLQATYPSGGTVCLAQGCTAWLATVQIPSTPLQPDQSMTLDLTPTNPSPLNMGLTAPPGNAATASNIPTTAITTAINELKHPTAIYLSGLLENTTSPCYHQAPLDLNPTPLLIPDPTTHNCNPYWAYNTTY